MEEFETESVSYSASDSPSEIARAFELTSTSVACRQATAPQRPQRMAACVTAVVAAISLSSWAYTPDAGGMLGKVSADQLGTHSPVALSKSELIEKVRQLRRLAPDWNGPGTRPPDSEAIEIALSIISSLPADVLPPRVGTAGDGEISIVWELAGYFADLGVQGNGVVDYYVRDIAGKKHFGDDIQFSESLPDELLALLPRANA